MRLALVTFAVLGFTGCSEAATAPLQSLPPHNPIQATASLQFTPREISIALGDSVTFVFASVEHSIEFQNGEELRAYYGGPSSAGAPANVALSTNTSVVRSFRTAGSFKFRCTKHAGMLGEVTVQ